jgi:hypothetical protein
VGCGANPSPLYITKNSLVYAGHTESLRQREERGLLSNAYKFGELLGKRRSLKLRWAQRRCEGGGGG